MTPVEVWAALSVATVVLRGVALVVELCQIGRVTPTRSQRRVRLRRILRRSVRRM